MNAFAAAVVESNKQADSNAIRGATGETNSVEDCIASFSDEIDDELVSELAIQDPTVALNKGKVSLTLTQQLKMQQL